MHQVKRGAGRPASVTTDKLCEDLKKYEIFDANKLLKPETDEVWSEIKDKEGYGFAIKTLYTNVKSKRKNLLEKLADHFFKKENSQIASQDIAKAENVAKNSDTLDDLLLLLSSVEFGGIIIETCAQRLHIIYCSPLQKNIWKNIYSKLDSPVVFTIANGFIEDIQIFNYHSNNIILYSLVVQLNDDHVPLFQVVSEKDDKEFIEYNMKEWLRLDMPTPSSVVIPPYMPVLQAAAKAFNGCSLQHYIYDLTRRQTINSNNSTEICVLRCDILPIFMHIDTLNVDEAIKKFYAKFMIRLSFISEWEIFKAEVEKLYVFMLSNRQNEYLTNERKILDTDFQADVNIDKLYEEYTSIDSTNNNAGFDMNDLICIYSDESIHKSIQDIEKQSKGKCTPYTGNLRIRANTRFIGEEQAKAFTNFLTFYPFWSNIYYKNDSINGITQLKSCNGYHDMLNKYLRQNNHTSSKRSCYYNSNTMMHSGQSIAVHDHFDKVSKLKVDDFVISHSKFLQDKLLKDSEIISTLKKRKFDNKVLTEQQTQGKKVDKSVEPMENWGGKAEVPKKPQYSINEANYSSVNPSFEDFSADQFLENVADESYFQSSLKSDTFYNYESYESCISAINAEHDYVSACTNYDQDDSIRSEDFKIKDESMRSGVERKNLNIAANRIPISNSTCITDNGEVTPKNLPTATSVNFHSTSSHIADDTALTTINMTIVPNVLPISTSTPIVQPKIKTAIAKSAIVNKTPKGMISKKKKKKPSKYYRAFREVREYYKKPRNRMYKSVLIENGQRKVYMYKGKRYIYENTSACDSIIEVLTRAVRYSDKFKEYCKDFLNANENSFLKIIVEYAEKNNQRMLYEQRCRLLLKYGMVYGHNFITLRKTVHLLFQDLMENLYSFTETSYCQTCGLEIRVDYHTKKVHLQDCNICNLQDYILQPSISICRDCQGHMKTYVAYHQYLAIDLSSADKDIDISKIPKTLSLKHSYTLVGLIRLILPYKKSKMKHYTAYSRTLTDHWKCYNNLSRKSNTSPKKIINVCLILYVKYN